MVKRRNSFASFDSFDSFAFWGDFAKRQNLVSHAIKYIINLHRLHGPVQLGLTCDTAQFGLT
jgi:hypothetical protein